MKGTSAQALVVMSLVFLGGCATSPPDKLDNICEIFREKRSWYDDARESRQRWGTPISVMMAFMHQESFTHWCCNWYTSESLGYLQKY